MSKTTDLADASAKPTPLKSKLPARLDFWQSATGLFLALFMWLHMFFVASILLGKDAMYTVAKFFEGYHFFGQPYPILVTIAAAGVFAVLIAHAGLAMRKFPANYRQYSTFRRHMKSLRHDDTNLWFIQVFTGFAMFFMVSIHLYIMMTQPHTIDPYGSGDRMVTDWMWPLYLLLLLAVELHASIGLYRLAVKWGWFEGKDAQATRRRLKQAKWAVTVFFLVMGLATLAAYIKVGLDNRDNYGQRYVPSWERQTQAPTPQALIPAAQSAAPDTTAPSVVDSAVEVDAPLASDAVVEPSGQDVGTD